jgi:tetratricopeptide (TPR) repeat protein
MLENYLELGIQAAQQGDMSKAIAYLSKAVVENPESEAAWQWLGDCLVDQDKRKYCYQRALKLNPNNQAARQRLAEFDPPPRSLQQPIPALLPVENQKGKSAKKTKTTQHPDSALVVGFGLAAFLIVCVSLTALLAVNGFFSPYLTWLNKPDTVEPSIYYPAITSTPLSTPTRNTPTPTDTPDLVATQTAQAIFGRLALTQANTVLSEAESLLQQEKYPEAILLLDQIIRTSPQMDRAYFLRAQCYLKRLKGLRNLAEYEAYVEQGLEDIDQAIALRADIGDYYIVRKDLLLSLFLEYREDQIHIARLMLENVRIASALGTTLEEYPERSYAYQLIYSDRCAEARDLLQDLIDRTDPKDISIGGLYHIQSQAYSCLGDVEKALIMVDKSMFNNLILEYKNRLKAQYLYYAGRYDESLAIWNSLIEQSPDYDEERYYWRAAVYYALGNRKLAEEDIRIGMGNTWSRAGLYFYVLGKLALDDGRTEEGIALLQQAEATLRVTDNILINRVRAELKTLGAVPLVVTPSFLVDATAIPTVQGTPVIQQILTTPTVVGSANLPSSQPTLANTCSSTIEDATLVDFRTGTGSMTFLANDYPVFHFKPPENMGVRKVNNLVIHLIALKEQGKPPLQISLYSPCGGGWSFLDPQWGYNPVQSPGDLVSPQGDIIIAVHNYSSHSVTIDNLNITLVIENNEGQSVKLGP